MRNPRAASSRTSPASRAHHPRRLTRAAPCGAPDRQNAWNEATSPGAAAFERKAVAGLLGLLRLPEGAAGALCSGATGASIIALAAARDAVLGTVSECQCGCRCGLPVPMAQLLACRLAARPCGEDPAPLPPCRPPPHHHSYMPGVPTLARTCTAPHAPHPTRRCPPPPRTRAHTRRKTRRPRACRWGGTSSPMGSRGRRPSPSTPARNPTARCSRRSASSASGAAAVGDTSRASPPTRWAPSEPRPSRASRRPSPRRSSFCKQAPPNNPRPASLWSWPHDLAQAATARTVLWTVLSATVFFFALPLLGWACQQWRL